MGRKSRVLCHHSGILKIKSTGRAGCKRGKGIMSTRHPESRQRLQGREVFSSQLGVCVPAILRSVLTHTV